MVVMTKERPAVPASEGRRGRSRSRVMLPALMVVQGAALAVLVGLDGEASWRVVRVLVVASVTATGMWLERRSGPIGRGAVALALGVVGTVAGAGIGGVHAAKAGASVTAVTGLVALATGLALLASGAAALTRSMRGWWRLLAVPAGLALVVFVLFPLTLALNVTNRPATPLGTATPADGGLAYRDVAFRTADGVRLSGWYVPSRNGAAVLLLHGAGSTRSAVLEHAVVLARHGYGALLLDTRGHGRSGGPAMDLGWYGDLDVAAAISFLQRQPDVHGGRIAVLGLSMGGEQAIVAAGSDPRIRAVVAEGVTGEQAADHGWLPRGVDGVVQHGLEWVLYTAADLMTGASPPMAMRDAILASGRPVLIVAGGAVADEPVAGRWFRAASPSTVHLWIVPDAGHTRALARRPGRWEARVTGFLDAALHPERR